MSDKKIKILELFGGIGAPRKALENIGANIKSIDYVEILPNAVKGYNSIFNNDYDVQDITKWNLDVDILIHGSPCQDFSKNGLNNIKTGRSILFERTLEIIENELNVRPKFLIWENVPNLISKRHKHHFDHYINSVTEMGYISKFKILNGKDFRVPQSRERIIVVSYLTAYEFEFPEMTENLVDIKDFLEDVNFEDYLPSENEMKLINYVDGELRVTEATKLGYKVVNEYDTINLEFPNSKTRRGRVGRQLSNTIATKPRIAIYYNDRIRMLTSKEHLTFMGYDPEDYNKMKNAGLTDKEITFLAGNSIVVPMLEEIFKIVLKEMEKVA